LRVEVVRTVGMLVKGVPKAAALVQSHVGAAQQRTSSCAQARSPGTAITSAPMPHLVGREAELAQLRGWLGSGTSERPRLALVEGEAGIGKTSLVQVVADEARVVGRRVAWANGVEDAGVPPYWLWRQVTTIEPGGDRYAYFQELARWVHEDGGVLLVVDDVQWADEPSLHALRHLLRQPSGCPLLVCATRRTGEATPGWDQVGPQLLAGPDVHRLQLQGLAESAAGELLQRAAGRPFAPGEVHQATLDSGGNPLYLRELGRLVAAGPGIAGRDLGELIAARVRRLAPATQRLLHAASVLAEEWELPVVARLLDVPTAACLAAVDEAVAVGLLTPAGAGRFRFSHALVRSVLAGQISLQESTALHLRAAEAIEDLHRDHLAPALADIARHWAAVAVTGHRAPAVAWSTRAADEAMRAVAFEEARRLYTMALDSGGTAWPLGQQADLHIARAGAAVAAGQLDEAFEDCRRAVTMAREIHQPELVARTALALEAIGDRRWDRSVREWCTEALAAFGEGSPTRARLLARLAEACVYGGEFDRGADYATEALQVAEAVEDADAEVAALRARQLTLSDPFHHEERGELAVRMTALGERTHRPEVELWGRLWAIDAMWEVGDLYAIAAEISRLRWCVEEVNTPTVHWHLLVSRAALAQARGEYGDALATGREGFELMMSMGHPAALGAFMSLAGTVGHHCGQTELTTMTAPPGADAGHGELRSELFGYIGPAFAMADVGRLEDAARLYRMPGPPQSWDIPPYFYVQALQVGADIAIAIGAIEDVAWFRSRLEPLRGRHVVGGAGSANYQGPVELVLGCCAAALGELDRAAEDLGVSVEIAARVGSPGFEVEAAVELAEVLTLQGLGRAAHALLQRVRPTAIRLGMAPWSTRIDAALKAPVDPLSAREREVAGLVAQGKSNREIAAALIVSERTAANHVQHILTKLGFANRSQIASWVSSGDPGAGR
jgi:DNA-binding CsgD family transcriptional regulator